MKSLAHPDWPYTGTPWEWRWVAERAKEAPVVVLMDEPSVEYVNWQTWQKLYFGPELP